jgi:hypothetical protein
VAAALKHGMTIDMRGKLTAAPGCLPSATMRGTSLIVP